LIDASESLHSAPSVGSWCHNDVGIGWTELGFAKPEPGLSKNW
jgi:hypothetical protein